MPHPSLSRQVAALAAVLTLLLAATARGQTEPGQRFDAHLDALAGVGSRLVGTDGHAAAERYLRKSLGRISGIETREHRYRLLTPVTREATLTLDGDAAEVFPLWPAKVRLNATPRGGITGRLVYCGGGRPGEVPPAGVQGQIAVIEADAGEWWKRPFFTGAAAVVLLGNDRVAWQQMNDHEIRVPANLPRVFLPDGDLADRLRRGVEGTATLEVVADWELREATNFYAFLPGTAGPAPALQVHVGYDTAGLVPDAPAGASQAAQPAAALALLETFAANPPRRPMLFTFSGADAINLHGTREMYLALGDVPRKQLELAEPVRERLEVDREHAARLAAVGYDPSRLDKVRDAELLERLLKVGDAEAADVQSELFRLRVRDADDLTEAERERKAELSAESVALGSARNALRSDPPSVALDADLADDAGRFARTLRERIDGTADAPGLVAQARRRVADLETRAGLYRWLADRTGTRRDPDARTSEGRPIDAMLGIDLSDGGPSLGPVGWGRFTDSENNALIQRLRDWFAAAKRSATDDPSHWYAQAGGRLDFDTFVAPEWKLGAPLATSAEMAAAWGVPGLTMATLHDVRPRRDTPADTLDRLDRDALRGQFTTLADVVGRAARDEAGFGVPGGFVRRNHRVEGQVLAVAPGSPVPDLPRPGFLAVMYHGKERKPTLNYDWRAKWALGVRRTEIVPTDAEGRYDFDGLDTLGHRDLRYRTIQVYDLADGTGEVVACSDNGRVGADFNSEIDLDRGTIRPLKSQTFECDEFALAGLFDPRFLQDLGAVLPRDARRNAEPQRYHFLLHAQLMAGFVEPGSRSYFLFRYGQIGNRLALLNVPGPDEPVENADRIARGFSVPELNDLGPLSLQAATDFYNLDSRRLDGYREAGVSSGLLDELHAQSGQAIAAAQSALETDDAELFQRSATGAWATEALVYSAAQAMANDVVRAAIFLLLLCVPFAFCLERLVIATPNVYRQIGGGLGIFAAMTLALWAFHPAFRITNSALIIILAFAILFMSGLVIWVVYSRFDTELRKVRSGTTSESTTSNSFARASVIGQAVMLGVANMRRRRFRTFLTAATIVLITFAVLCFTSSTTYTSVTKLPTGEQSEHPGIMLRQRGFRSIPPQLLPGVEAVGGALFPGRAVVPRWWNQNNSDQFTVFVSRVDGEGRIVTVPQRAALGVSPGEAQLTPLDSVLGPDAAARLQDPAAAVVAVSEPIATALGARVGDALKVGGLDLELVAVYDPDAYDAQMTSISGEPVAPLDVTAGMLDAGGRLVSDANAETLSLGGAESAAEADASYEHLSSVDFILIPAAISAMLPEYGLRSVSVRLDDQAQVDAAVTELTRRYALATFAAYDDGVKLVSASQPTSVAGTAIVVPLMIGGLIIFNTMMGSIAERRKEIHVYTSLGLAPSHVGALFVAEALTYGLIGAVFGYVVGQLVGTLLMHLDWLGGATLNYSGTSAMLTMGLILVVVLLSALVPARVASKIASPSIDRTWKLPQPQDGVITARLPFTINKTAAAGALAFLADHFDAHRDGTIGKFSADDITPFTLDRGGEHYNGLRASIWLTPFDLGVRQDVEVLIAPGDIEDVYEVDVTLTRQSGSDDAWYRMNRSFLTDLRQQFLAWRTLSPQRMLEYVGRSKAMFGGQREVGRRETGDGLRSDPDG